MAKLNTNSTATKGGTTGAGVLSSDCLAGSPYAYTWHSVDCSGSIPSQFGMSSIIVGAVETPILLPADIPGQAYEATASCMNSILKIATMVVSRRLGYDVFMRAGILTFFLDYAVTCSLSNGSLLTQSSSMSGAFRRIDLLFGIGRGSYRTRRPSRHPAQQESCFTSLLKVCAANFNPSTMVR